MRSWWVIQAAVVVALVVGPLGEAPSTVGAAQMGTDTHDPAGRFVFERTGGPGDWVFIYLPLQNKTHDFWVDYDVTLDAAAGGERFGAIHMGPLPVLGLLDGTIKPRFWRPWIDVAYSKDGEPLSLQGSGLGWSGDRDRSFTGVAFLAASDGHWSYRLEVLTDALADPVVLSGNDTVAVPTTAGVRTPGAGIQEIVTTFDAPGWTHLDILHDPVVNAGWRITHVRFPAGFGFSDNEPWDAVPTYGEPSLTYMGLIADTQGEFFARSTYMEPTLDYRLVVFHMPGLRSAMGPDWRDGFYSDFHEPT